MSTMPRSTVRHRPISEGTAAQYVAGLNIPARQSAKTPRATRIWQADEEKYPSGGGTAHPDVQHEDDLPVEEYEEEVVLPAQPQRSATRPAPQTDESEKETETLYSDEGEEDEAIYAGPRAFTLPEFPRSRPMARRPIVEATRPVRRREEARYALQPVRQTCAPRTTDDFRRARYQVHWLVYVGLGMILLLVLYIYAIFPLCVWANNVHNDWTYGMTRTSHLDAVIGDHDSKAQPTHLIAINMNGKVEILEFPGGDATHAKVFPGPHLTGNDAQKAVILLEVKDMTGDGRPDVLVHVIGALRIFGGNQQFDYVLVNTGSGLKLQTLQQ